MPENRITLSDHARDLADPTFARRSLRAARERRATFLRRRRTTRGGRSLALVMAATLSLGAVGAVAHESGGSSPKRAAVSSNAGYDVAAVQRKLGIPADGIAGPQTRRAIKRFQRRNGLTVDGVVGPQTLAALGLPVRAASSRKSRRRTTSRSGLLARIAACESGGNPRAVSPDGRYRGKYQFSRATWRGLGGKGDPAAASEAEQDRMAALLLETQGPGAWPNCAR